MSLPLGSFGNRMVRILLLEPRFGVPLLCVWKPESLLERLDLHQAYSGILLRPRLTREGSCKAVAPSWWLSFRK